MRTFGNTTFTSVVLQVRMPEHPLTIFFTKWGKGKRKKTVSGVSPRGALCSQCPLRCRPQRIIRKHKPVRDPQGTPGRLQHDN